jgi:hypothetical protein
VPKVRTLLLAPALLLALAFSSARAADDEGWIEIFNGKNLDGWKASEKPENWTVEDGMIVGRGERSHLFYMAQEFTDLEYEAEVKLNPQGNSGMYFRTQFGTGWPTGYEAQVNNTSRDPKKTGSLYNFVNVTEQLIQDDTFWTQRVIARGNHIIIQVNGKTVVDHVDEKKTHSKGYIALQQHDPGSVVTYRRVRVRPLPPATK